MPSKLRYSKFLLLCLVVVAVDVRFLHSSSARSRKIEQQERISQGTDGSRNWNSYPPRLSLRSIQSAPTRLHHSHQSILTAEAQSGTNNIVANQREGPPDGHEIQPLNSSQQLAVSYALFEPSSPPGNKELTTVNNKSPTGTQESEQLYIKELNSFRAVKAGPVPRTSKPFIAPPVFAQSGGLSSISEPIMAVHYLNTSPWSGLGSPIVQRNLGAPGNTQSFKTSSIRSGQVTPSILQAGGNNLGSSVAERIHVHVQQSENPLSDEEPKYRKVRHKGIREGLKTRNTHVISSPTQREVNPSVHESGTSTDIKKNYGYTGSRLYLKSFTSDNRPQASVQLQTLSNAASSDEYAPSVSQPFYHNPNSAEIVGIPRSYSSSEMVSPQARRALNRFHPGSRFGFFQNAETQPTLGLPTKRETASPALAPNQSLKTRSRHVSIWNEPALRRSSKVQNGGETGRYKVGKAQNVNTLFGFKGFQYQAPKTLASIVPEEHHLAVAKSQSTGWRQVHGTSRGMKMGSVSGYPPVFKKYGFVSSAPSTFISETQKVKPMPMEDKLFFRNIGSAHYFSKVLPATEVLKSNSASVDHSADAVSSRRAKVLPHKTNSLQKDDSETGTKPSSPSFAKQSSDYSVRRRLNPLSNIHSSEVQTMTNTTPRSTQQVRHVFRSFHQAPNQPSHPQRESLNNIQPVSVPPSNQVHIGSSTGAIPDPITLSLFKPEAKYKHFGFVSKSNLGLKPAGEKWPSASHVESAPPEIQPISLTRTTNQYRSVDGDASRKRDDESSYDNTKSNLRNFETDKMMSKHFNPESSVRPKSSNRYADMVFQILKNNAGTTRDKVAALSPQIMARSTPSFSKVLTSSQPEEDSREHPSLTVPTPASSVHPAPDRVQLDPNPTGLTSSRNPTSSVRKGKRVKGPNLHSFSFSLPPSNDTVPLYVLRPGKVDTDRFKTIQFADIQGSASFSGVPQRAVSRPTVQTMAKTTALGQDGYTLERGMQTTDKNFTTVLGQDRLDILLESPQGKSGRAKAVPAFSSNVGASGESDVSSVQWDIEDLEGDFSGINRAVRMEKKRNLSGVTSEESTDKASWNLNLSEEESELNYLRTSTAKASRGLGERIRANGKLGMIAHPDIAEFLS